MFILFVHGHPREQTKPVAVSRCVEDDGGCGGRFGVFTRCAVAAVWATAICDVSHDDVVRGSCTARHSRGARLPDPLSSPKPFLCFRWLGCAVPWCPGLSDVGEGNVGEGVFFFFFFPPLPSLCGGGGVTCFPAPRKSRGSAAGGLWRTYGVFGSDRAYVSSPSSTA